MIAPKIAPVNPVATTIGIHTMAYIRVTIRDAIIFMVCSNTRPGLEPGILLEVTNDPAGPSFRITRGMLWEFA